MPLTFDRPPLNEVIVGYSFLPRPDLLIPHVGRLWVELGSDAYPDCRHAPVIIDGSQQAEIDVSMPRVWFLNDETGFLIQYQQDRFLVNWRDLGKGSTKYVRFPAVLAEFLRVDAVFRTYVERITQIPVQPTGFTMSYVNLIRHGEGWTSFEDLGKVFPAFKWEVPSSGRTLKPKAAGWRLEFELPGGLGTLIVTLGQGKTRVEGTPVLRFELTANSGAAGVRDFSAESWCIGAHEAIIHTFKDLTGPDMHRDHWSLNEE